MRKNFLIGLSVIGLALTGCSTTAETTYEVPTQLVNNFSANNNSYDILCSSYPVYEWTKAVVGDSPNIEVTLLMDNGVDLHNYQATAADIIKINTSDVCIYIGGDSEYWIEDVVEGNGIKLMNELENYIKEEAYSDGMQHDHDHDHDHDHEHTEDCDHDHEHTDECDHDHDDHDHIHEEEAEEEACQMECCAVTTAHVHDDEHIWLSAKLAVLATEIIADAVIALDPANESIYNANAQSYITQLEQLDSAFQEVVDNSTINTLIFGDRFPFLYLVEDYGIDYYAAFSGCSTETEATFETIIFLAEKLDETDAASVCYISDTNKSIAEVVSFSANTEQPLVQFNSIEIVTQDDIAAGVTYLELMYQNVAALEKALQ
ncbi:MAG: hypothetical protein ATN34_01140 [Epulopiscium sp. Nele67-Bin002]|nr:MAG: hypothetical protein ATN34_01140 [Epulopiscium sp. Nele67-Bin002]